DAQGEAWAARNGPGFSRLIHLCAVDEDLHGTSVIGGGHMLPCVQGEHRSGGGYFRSAQRHVDPPAIAGAKGIEAPAVGAFLVDDATFPEVGLPCGRIDPCFHGDRIAGDVHRGSFAAIHAVVHPIKAQRVPDAYTLILQAYLQGRAGSRAYVAGHLAAVPCGSGLAGVVGAMGTATRSIGPRAAISRAFPLVGDAWTQGNIL